MAKRNKSPEEAKRYKIQKRLEALNYTPQSAIALSGFLRGLAHDLPELRKARLRAFEELSKLETPSWRK